MLELLAFSAIFVGAVAIALAFLVGGALLAFWAVAHGHVQIQTWQEGSSPHLWTGHNRPVASVSPKTSRHAI